MTFEEALKLLAEKEPKRFYWGEGRRFKWHFGIVDAATGLRVHTITQYHDGGTSEITQDDIDAILAQIGWEYELTRWINLDDFLKDVPDGWFMIAGKLPLTPMKQYQSVVSTEMEKTFPTKLEAAKAALIAVVEKEYGGQP